MSEKLSALMDGELSEHEQRQLVRGMLEDSALRDAWSRYHVIRAALHRDGKTVVATDIATKVRMALRDEQADVAPAATTRMVRAAGMVAIAATVAAITLFGVQHVFGPAAEAPLFAKAPGTKPAQSIHTVRWEKQKPEMERVLNSYLVEHNEFTPANGVSSMLGPNVRVVAYDSKP